MPKSNAKKKSGDDLDASSNIKSERAINDTSDDNLEKPKNSRKRVKMEVQDASDEESPVSDKEASTSDRGQTDDGALFFRLSKSRRVTVRKFKNKVLVDIRDYYLKDGKENPGSKGISLTTDQYAKLKELLSDIDTAVEDLT